MSDGLEGPACPSPPWSSSLSASCSPLASGAAASKPTPSSRGNSASEGAAWKRNGGSSKDVHHLRFQATYTRTINIACKPAPEYKNERARCSQLHHLLDFTVSPRGVVHNTLHLSHTFNMCSAEPNSGSSLMSKSAAMSS